MMVGQKKRLIEKVLPKHTPNRTLIVMVSCASIGATHFWYIFLLISLLVLFIMFASVNILRPSTHVSYVINDSSYRYWENNHTLLLMK